jgi:hypothetical protein
MSHHFQFTYSVRTHSSNPSDELIKITERVRKGIKSHDAWESLENIETTVVGELTLSGTLEDKISEARSDILKELKSKLKGVERKSEFTIYGSLMVDKLGAHIELKI